MNSRLVLRLVAPVLAISLLLVITGAGSAWYVYRLQKDASDILAVNIASIRAASELQVGLLEVRGLVKDYQATGDRHYLDAVGEYRRETDRWRQEVERLALTPGEQGFVARLGPGYAHFFEEFDRLTGPAALGNPTRADMRVLAQDILAREVLQPAREYLDYNEDLAVQSSERNRRTVRLLVPALVLLGTCGSVAGLVAGYGIARGIARSIGQLARPIRDAAGKLGGVASPVETEGGPELRDMEATLDRVAHQVGAVMARLQAREREVLRSGQLAAVGQLAAGLAHELRNPLMAMKLLIQPAAEAGSPDQLSERDLEVLNEEITRLEGLIQTFLDFARPPRPEKSLIELRSALEQTAVLVARRAENQGVRVEVAVPAESLTVEADLGQVRQVLLNLSLNALDATPEGGTVTLRAWCEAGAAADGDGGGPGEWLVLEVADTGRGLPADLGARIFEPFVSTKETGLGLGLSVCERIVQAHGGDIRAGERPQGGAVFTVRLPASSRPGRPGGGAGLPGAASPAPA